MKHERIKSPCFIEIREWNCTPSRLTPDGTDFCITTWVKMLCVDRVQWLSSLRGRCILCLISSKVSHNSNSVEWIVAFQSFRSLSYDRSTATSKTSLQRERSSASSFSFQCPLVSLRSSSSCSRLLPRLPLNSVHPSILSSIRFRLSLHKYFRRSEHW